MPRKQKKKYHYLYKTTNSINGKYYIGIHSTYKIKDGYLGSGTKLWNSIYKYGKENFIKEELEFFESREELLQREKEVVNEQLINDPLCMNLQPGGGGGFSSEEHKKKFQENQKNWINEKWKDPEYRKKRIDAINWTNKKHKNETKEKIGEVNSIKQKGEKNSQYGTCWITNGKENKKIKKENLNKYLILGWIKGRVNCKTPNSKNTYWVNNGIKNKRIKKNELEKWLNEKWIKGKI